MKKTKIIVLEKEHVDWIERANISFSKWVRSKIDLEISNELNNIDRDTQFVNNN